MPVFDPITLIAVWYGAGLAALVLTFAVRAIRRELSAEEVDLAGIYRPSRSAARPAPAVGRMPVVVVPVGTDITAPGVGHTCDPLTCELPPVGVDAPDALLCGQPPVPPDLESFTDAWSADTIRRALIPPNPLAELVARVEAVRDVESDTTVDTTAIRAEAAA